MNERLKKLLKDQLLVILGLRYGVLRRRRNIKKAIKLYWWHDYANGIANFGDEITKEIISKIYGYKCTLSSIEECELIGAGSILEVADGRRNNNTINVWGSGFIRPREGKDSLKNLIFHAVRGEETRERIGKSVVLGDPGLLANLIYQRATRQTDKVGIVVHFIDSEAPIITKLKDDTRFIIINPLDTPKNVAQRITSCKLILSSSLHGLIFADSFNIPNIHVHFSDRVIGGAYKFKDYYSAVGKKYQAADLAKIFDDEYLDQLKFNYLPIKNLRLIQRRLIKSFPQIW